MEGRYKMGCKVRRGSKTGKAHRHLVHWHAVQPLHQHRFLLFQCIQASLQFSIITLTCCFCSSTTGNAGRKCTHLSFQIQPNLSQHLADNCLSLLLFVFVTHCIIHRIAHYLLLHLHLFRLLLELHHHLLHSWNVQTGVHPHHCLCRSLHCLTHQRGRLHCLQAELDGLQLAFQLVELCNVRSRPHEIFCHDLHSLVLSSFCHFF
mmetsp:Transcript_49932/g.128483  ORF Transcript_49932/g.128483 Transcript_49932/m.128483 type:complete len:205 (+) Transcript_49932:1481-2095(+)